MDFLDTYFVGLLAILILMVALWLLSLAARNASIMDIFWGPGFMFAALIYILLTPQEHAGYLDRARAYQALQMPRDYLGSRCRLSFNLNGGCVMRRYPELFF